jgi:hypothetical protein
MQAERSIATATRTFSARRSQPRRRSRFSVTVPANDAEALRRALFAKLDHRIERIVIAAGIELGSREPLATLHLVTDREAVDEALHIVMSTASSAQFGRVQHY